MKARGLEAVTVNTHSSGTCITATSIAKLFPEEDAAITDKFVGLGKTFDKIVSHPS